MSDVFDKEKRSQIMRSVKSKNTKSTELAMIALFKANNIIGWRRTYDVKGHPDFVFLSKKIAIFLDGCFWHGHNCRNTHPVDHAEYWSKKRERNIQHDKEITSQFERRGWTVIRIWECELKKKRITDTAQNSRSLESIVFEASALSELSHIHCFFGAGVLENFTVRVRR